MTGADGAKGGRAAWIRTNQGVAACVAAVVVGLLIYIGSSEWAYDKLRDGFRLGFFSAFSAFVMLLCAVAIMTDRHRHETDEGMAAVRWKDWVIAAGAMATCYVYFELAWRIDFILVSPLFVAGGTYALGVRPLRAALIAGAVITLVIYGLFRMIGIELPSRIIGF